MTEYLIQGETLTGIADAIREKTGGTDPVAVSDMAGKIAGIEAGGGDIDALIDRSITEISSSSLTIIGSYAFNGCEKLTTADFPAVTSIESSAFYFCKKLKAAYFPAATSIGSNSFYNCVNITTADFPAATSILNSAFNRCVNLKTVNLPAVKSINSNSFYSCATLKSLLLRGNDVCTLSSANAFDSTPIKSGTGYIYVPSALIEQYKAATNWSTYATQFRALEDYTVDGTTTGELDPAKTGT